MNLFLIVIYHSTLVKGAMNAARVCKLRTGVKKNASISSFFTGQRRNKDPRTCQLRRDRVFEA
jgi:hypothetical protein